MKLELYMAFHLYCSIVNSWKTITIIRWINWPWTSTTGVCFDTWRRNGLFHPPTGFFSPVLYNWSCDTGLMRRPGRTTFSTFHVAEYNLPYNFASSCSIWNNVDSFFWLGSYTTDRDEVCIMEDTESSCRMYSTNCWKVFGQKSPIQQMRTIRVFSSISDG